MLHNCVVVSIKDDRNTKKAVYSFLLAHGTKDHRVCVCMWMILCVHVCLHSAF